MRALPLIAALLASGMVARAEGPYSPWADPTFPFFGLSVDASPADLPRGNWVPRGIVVRLDPECWALYDVDLARLAAVWKGGFPRGVTIAQHSYANTRRKAGGGQGGVPRIPGPVLAASGMFPGAWTGAAGHAFEDPRDRGPDPLERGRGPADFARYGRWRRVSDAGDRAVIDWSLGDARVSEWWQSTPEALVRHFAIDRPPGDLRISLARLGGPAQSLRLVDAPPGARLELAGGEHLVLAWEGTAERLALAVAYPREHPAGPAGRPAHEPGIDRPRKTIAHWGVVEAGPVKPLPPGDGPWVVEGIPLPLENPSRRPVRPTAVAFGAGGDAVVTTVDGDVWKALPPGLDEPGTPVRWRRFAAGLHEPYSVALRDGEVFTFTRSGLQRLHDVDGDGEADHYEWFAHDFWQSAETRDFPHDMVLRPDGGFYLVKGGQQNDHRSPHSGRVLSVAPDGERVEVFSSGHRNAFLGLDPARGDLFACDQQGHWTPTTPVQRLRPGGYYGFRPAAPAGIPEPPVDPPLAWVPHRAAQSAVDLVFTGKARLGSLDESLLCLDYYRPGLLRIHPGGAAMALDVPFSIPLLKGAVRPADGWLYLTGFQIWGTRAGEDAGFCRLRPRPGVRDLQPASVSCGREGVLLTFPVPLDRERSRRIEHFHLQAWNYRRSADYGSGHYRADGSAGQEPVAVAGAHLAADGRTLFLHVPAWVEHDQAQLGYDLRAADGAVVAGTVYLTPRRLPALDLAAAGFADLDLAAEAAAIRRQATPGTGQRPPDAAHGREVATLFGCVACHSLDGSTEGRSGPTWKGLYGRRRSFLEGDPATADDAYLREAILDPAARILEGYDPRDVGMPSYRGILSERDLESILLFLREISGDGPAGGQTAP